MGREPHKSACRWPLLLFPLLVGVVGWLVNEYQSFSELKNYVNGRVIPQVLTQSGRSGKEFRILDTGSGLIWQALDTNLAPEQLPSTTNLEPALLATGVRIVSVVSDSELVSE